MQTQAASWSAVQARPAHCVLHLTIAAAGNAIHVAGTTHHGRVACAPAADAALLLLPQDALRAAAAAAGLTVRLAPHLALRLSAAMVAAAAGLASSVSAMSCAARCTSQKCDRSVFSKPYPAAVGACHPHHPVLSHANGSPHRCIHASRMPVHHCTAVKAGS